LKIRYLDSVDSTQLYLKDLIKNKKVMPPYGVVANKQNAGIGSRNNSWIGLDGNFFFSFAIKIDELPTDLKLESASIYFAYLLKESLEEFGSNVWLKWPNDFYIENKKIGGMITNIVDSTLICGVGINLVKNPQDFARLDIEISRDEILKSYIDKIYKNYKWKQVFSKYRLEFGKSKEFFTHKENEIISLKSVVLENDGSIISDGERIYSLR
jgi:BirA family biotin operon repressor/biotin-[acetyl-CoA-carboxylase] ligase